MKFSQPSLATRPCPKACCAEEVKDPGCWASAEVGARRWFSTQTWMRKLALGSGSGCLTGCSFLGVRWSYSERRRGLQGMEGQSGGHYGGPFE